MLAIVGRAVLHEMVADPSYVVARDAHGVRTRLGQRLDGMGERFPARSILLGLVVPLHAHLLERTARSARGGTITRRAGFELEYPLGRAWVMS